MRILVICTLVSLAHAVYETPQTSLASEYTSAVEDHTPHLSPGTPPGATSTIPSRVVYDDEDPEAARLAWFRGRAEQAETGARWHYIEERLRHPAELFHHEPFSAPTHSAGEGVNEAKDGTPVFTFSATKDDAPHRVSGDAGDGVPVEKVEGNVMTTANADARVGREMPRSPPRGLAAEMRMGMGMGRARRARFNEGGLRRSAALRGHTAFAPVEVGDRPALPFINTGRFAAAARRTAGGVDRGDHGGGGGDVGGGDGGVAEGGMEGLREHSPTKWALDSAAFKLSTFAPDAARSRAAQRSLSPPSSGPDSVGGGFGVTQPSTPRTLTASGSSTPHEPLTPPHPWQPHSIAPYRMWSVRTALPTINLVGMTKLTDRYPGEYAHWHSSLRALSGLEWEHQLSSRLKWVAEHRIDTTRAARVVTPFGAVTGGDIETGTPTYIYDPAHPAPHLDSLVLTPKHRRIKSWKELATLLPPALTGHSSAVYTAHKLAGYDNIPEDSHLQIHPIQYTSQIMRDRNAATILENSIYDTLHKDLQSTPPEVIAQLRNTRAKQKATLATAAAKGKQERTRGTRRSKPQQGTETLDDLLGTEYATHNRFWYEFYHDKPAFKIKNPLHTPLEEFAAFAPFADAVALRKPL